MDTPKPDRTQCHKMLGGNAIMSYYKLNMKSLIISITVFVNLICCFNSNGQKLISVQMDSLSNDKISWSYIGNGEFMEMRSCYIRFIECTFESAVYDCINHRLFLKGKAFNSNSLFKNPISFAQILIGGSYSDSSKVKSPSIIAQGKDTSAVISPGGFYVRGKHFNVNHKLEADSLGNFQCEIQINAVSDQICIVPTDKEDSNELATTKTYSIGWLLKFE